MSQRVSRLEEWLGVRLVERTTRVVRATAAGAAYSEQCARILAELDDANASVKASVGAQAGLLRVAVPQLFSEVFLIHAAAEFTKRHPSIAVEIIATEGTVQPIEEGRLLRLLEGWSVPRKDLRVVYPSNRHLSPRVRAFVDLLVAYCRRRVETSKRA